MCVTGQMMANVRGEASRTGHRESSRSQGGHVKAHQEGTVEERPRTSGSSPRALGEGLPGSRGPQGKAHMAGLAWDAQGTASSLYSWGRGRKGEAIRSETEATADWEFLLGKDHSS